MSSSNNLPEAGRQAVRLAERVAVRAEEDREGRLAPVVLVADSCRTDGVTEFGEAQCLRGLG